MHSGLEVFTDSDYEPGAMELMRQNRGVHEPQEERAFQLVLSRLRPDAVMIELGAYWCFYSMWFARVVGQRARCDCIEVMEQNLSAGRRNVARNGMDRQFTLEHAFADSWDGVGEDGVRRVSVPGLMQAYGLDRIDLLHADVQGAEEEVLKGTSSVLREGRIAYLFISTHSTKVHTQCRKILQTHRYSIGVDVTPTQSVAYDGLIVATAPRIEPVRVPDISRRQGKPPR